MVKVELSFDRLLVGLVLVTIASLASVMPAGPDTYWHLRAGEEIWTTLRVPLTDHYSFTASGRPWPNHEWLWQALSYGLFRAGGMPLLNVAGAALVTGAFLIAYRLMAGPASTRFLILLLGLPVASCMWTPRPQLLSLFFLAVLLRLLVAERYVALPFLFAVWANAHGVVALGGLVLGAAAVAALLTARSGGPAARRRALVILLIVPLCAAATALTPLGFGLWRAIGASIAFSRRTGITEWMPSYPETPFGVLLLALAISFIAVLFWRRRRLATAPWGDIVLTAAVVALLPLAFYAIRNAPMFLLAGMPAASRLLGATFAVKLPGWTSVGDRPRLNLAILGAVSLAGAALVARMWSLPHPHLGWRPISTGAIEAVRACPSRVYNHYNDGGYLVWFVPDRPVFIDGRQDPYPLSLVLEHIEIENGAPHEPLFRRYGIGCAILRADSAMALRLEGVGWLRRFADESWIVLSAPRAQAPS